MKIITVEDCHELKNKFTNYCKNAEQHQFSQLAVINKTLNATITKIDRDGEVKNQKEARAMFRVILKIIGEDFSEYKEDIIVSHTPALQLAKYIVTKCVNDNQPITNMYLQHILYKIQKEWLKHKSRAFYDDFETRPFGPIIPNVYNFFCNFGVMPITNKYPDIFIKYTKTKETIDAIIEKERIKPVWDISDKGCAWKRTMSENAEQPGHTIPIEYITQEAKNEKI